MTDDRTILLFVRAPRRGAVKSRLAAVLDDDVVLALYQNFVLDTIDTLDAAAIPFRVHVHPPEGVAEVSVWLGGHRGCLPQAGADLGERMEEAFQAAFRAGVSRAVLIGSDIPDLPADLLREAFRSLDEHDAVIGPAADGGYFLFGSRSETFRPEVFRGISWSTSAVFAATMHRLRELCLNTALLAPRRDVDTIDDLRDLFRRNRSTAFARSRTMVYLDAMRDVIVPPEEPDASI